MQWPSDGGGGGKSAQGVSAKGVDVSARGWSAQGGCAPYLWTEFLTQACENITFPQLRLRTVKIRGNRKWINTISISILEQCWQWFFSTLYS